jgi:hypothetical protein
MTTQALVVKSLFQIGSELRAMARNAADALISFFEFTLVQNVFPILIEVMAVLARKPCFNMVVVRKRHSRACLAFQYNLIRLRPEGSPGQYQKKTNRDHQSPAAYHFHTFLLWGAPLLHYNQLSDETSSS